MRVRAAIREWAATVLVRLGQLDPLSIEIRIANSRVMGAGAVTSTAVLMGIAGVASLVDLGGSDVLSRFGGEWLDALWSSTLVLALVLVLIARWREKADPTDAAWLEIGGILMIAAVFALFTVIVVMYVGGGGALFLVMAFASKTFNLVARAWLLWRRIVWLGKAAKR